MLLLATLVVPAFPVSAFAANHLSLYITPSPIAKGWTLDGAVVDGAFFSGAQEEFGVTLHHRFLKGRAHELHAFRAAPLRSLSFDGVRGRWDARFGGMLTVRMAIRAAHAPSPVDEVQGCRGAFMRVPVSLRGTFTLPTRTRVFKTVHRTRLWGVLAFNSGGPVTCTPPAESPTCLPTTYFGASAGCRKEG